MPEESSSLLRPDARDEDSSARLLQSWHGKHDEEPSSDPARSDRPQPSHTVAYDTPRNPWWLSALQMVSSMIGDSPGTHLGESELPNTPQHDLYFRIRVQNHITES